MHFFRTTFVLLLLLSSVLADPISKVTKGNVEMVINQLTSQLTALGQKANPQKTRIAANEEMKLHSIISEIERSGLAALHNGQLSIDYASKMLNDVSTRTTISNAMDPITDVIYFLKYFTSEGAEWPASLPAQARIFRTYINALGQNEQFVALPRAIQLIDFCRASPILEGLRAKPVVMNALNGFYKDIRARRSLVGKEVDDLRKLANDDSILANTISEVTKGNVEMVIKQLTSQLTALRQKASTPRTRITVTEESELHKIIDHIRQSGLAALHNGQHSIDYASKILNDVTTSTLISNAKVLIADVIYFLEYFTSERAEWPVPLSAQAMIFKTYIDALGQNGQLETLPRAIQLIDYCRESPILESFRVRPEVMSALNGFYQKIRARRHLVGKEVDDLQKLANDEVKNTKA